MILDFNSSQLSQVDPIDGVFQILQTNIFLYLCYNLYLTQEIIFFLKAKLSRDSFIE